MSGTLNFKKAISEKACCECGKEFTFTIPRSQYLYKRLDHGHMKYFCSDKCKRKWEKGRNLK